MRLSFLFIALVLMGCSEKSKTKEGRGYVIQGQLAGFKDSTMLQLEDSAQGKIIDSIWVVNNEFTLSGKVQHPGRYILKTKFAPDAVETFKYLFFWIDNSDIKINGDFENFKYAKVEGSKLHELAWEFTSARMELDKQREMIVDSLRSNTGDSQKLRIKIQEIDSSITAMTIQFIRTKPNNLVSLEQLSFINNKFSKEELGKIYNLLDEELKQSVNGIILENYISIDKILEKGDQIVSMTGENLKGESVELSKIIKKNEYTILDFWAAGCGPCRLQSKQYAELYSKYRGKGLEIVSFSLDKNRKIWKTASKEDNISWVNMSDLKGPNGKAPMTYGVKGIPNSFLIDKNGVIVAEFFGFDRENAPFTKELIAFFEPDALK